MKHTARLGAVLALIASALAACASVDPVERAARTHAFFCALSPEARARIREQATEGVKVILCPDERPAAN